MSLQEQLLHLLAYDRSKGFIYTSGLIKKRDCIIPCFSMISILELTKPFSEEWKKKHYLGYLITSWKRLNRKMQLSYEDGDSF